MSRPDRPLDVAAEGDRTSPLERRYRRLLRLLPARDRAAHGDELLGLLLDLDDGRDRPSVRQSTGLIALALRLRLAGLPRVARLAHLPAAGNALFAAFLVAYGTGAVGELIDDYTGGFLPGDLIMLRHHAPALLVAALVPVGVTVAWILRARRTALILQLGVTVWTLPGVVRYARGLPHFPGYWLAASLWLVPDLLILAVLAVGARRRWNAPTPRLPWLAAVPLAALAWKGIEAWGRHGMYPPTLAPITGWIAAVVLAAVAAGLTRRRGWPRMLLAALVGLGIGRLLPTVAVNLCYGRYGWLVPLTVATVVLAGGAGRLARRRASG